MAISFISATEYDETVTVVVPSGIEADDFLLVQSGTKDPTTTPAGWTHLARQDAVGGFGDATQDIYYRVADGTEDGSSLTFGAADTIQEKRALLQYRGVDTSTPIEDWASDYGVGSSVPTVDGPAVVQSAASSLVVALICVWSGTSYNPLATAAFADTSEVFSSRIAIEGFSANAIQAHDAFRSYGGGWRVGVIGFGSSGSELVDGTGVIDWDPDPTSRRTFFTLSLKAA